MAEGSTQRLRLIALLVIISLCGLVAVFLTNLESRSTERQNGSGDTLEIFELALRAIDQNQHNHAKQLLQECLSESPKHVSARLYYGQLLREEGEIDAAVEIWRSIHEGTPDERATARYLEGSVAIEKQEVHRSRDLLEESVLLNPHYLQAWEKLLIVYRMLRSPEKILQVIGQIKKLRGLTMQELVLRTVPYDAGYSVEQSMEVLRHSFEEKPTDLEVACALASVYLEARNPEECLALVEQFNASMTEQYEVLAYRVLAFLEQGNLQAALRECERQEEQRNHSEGWIRACSRVAFRAQDWQRAAVLMKRVYRAAPNDQLNCYHYGLVTRQLGKESLSLQLLDRSVRLDNVNRLALRLTRESDPAASHQALPLIRELASELSALGRHSEAADWYGMATELSPMDSEIVSLYRAELLATSRMSPNLEDDQIFDIPHDGITSQEMKKGMDSLPQRHDQSPGVAIQFEDIHESVGLVYKYFNGQTGFHHLIESMGGGVIVIDYDGDGWDDLYFPQGCRLPYDPESTEHTDLLYRNIAGTKFEEVTAFTGLGSNRYGLGGTALDYDNDGDVDLFVTNYGANQLFENNGDGTFSDISDVLEINPEEMSTSITSGDFNNDGFLDLYVANYLERLKVCRSADEGFAPCDPGNFNGQMDRLLINDGSGKFTDQSLAAGLNVSDSKGLGVVAADFDGDGQTDVYVANDGVPNFLWKNVTSQQSEIVRFEEIGLQSGTAVDKRGRSQAGMGIAIADFNHDQLVDLYVTNFFEEHNTLYLNRGDFWFEDRTKAAGLYSPTLSQLGFGAVARDFNGDGTQDLLIANGHIFRDSSGSQPWKMPAQVFANLGSGMFEDRSHEAGDFFKVHALGRGVGALDWNRDNRCDAVIVHQDRSVAMLENRGEMSSEVFSVRLIGVNSNRAAIGAEIRLIENQGEMKSYWVTQGGYLGSHSQIQEIVNPQSQSLQLKVHWPSGSITAHQIGTRSAGKLKKQWILIENGQTLDTVY